MKFTLASLATAGLASAVTIAEINGNKFISPYKDQSVSGVEGLVTAKSSYGFYIRSLQPDDDDATSESLYVYDSSSVSKVEVGDIITLSGKVTEYRSSSSYIYLTELSSPSNIVVKSSGNTVTPKVIGVDTLSPPTEQFTSLDGGDVYAVPNGVYKISTSNPVLDPVNYGLDFWESLSGELVTVRSPVGVSRPNSYGDTWVVGDWTVTGRNAHGGITMTPKDSNPEAILVGSPLDGSDNKDWTKMGDEFADVTGIVTYAYGFYRILPTTALQLTKNATTDYPATSLVSKGNCTGISISGYNTRNLAPTSSHMPKVAAQIVDYLKTPDIIMLQEIQDNTGPKDDGVVSANVTLATLAGDIKDMSGVEYSWVEIEPANDEDGGEPGGNIRQAYLYRADIVELVDPNFGTATNGTEVVKDGKYPSLTFNPGRIDPTNSAWDDSRKPLIAMWRAIDGPHKNFFTVNIHFTSKGGSTSIQGDVRPPINKGVEKRTTQATIVGEFIGEIMAIDEDARVVIVGDFNEFVFVQPMVTFLEKSGMVDLNEMSGLPANERYSYVYDMNSQELDRMFASPALAKKARYEHVHLNSWKSYDDQVSDHDPALGLYDVCGC
ncbi:hypothetical protein TD95_003450 [Thielaviopsis punctulata]|uniref:Endonuclease/exonuclease/phosphatase domain-containing protein n=1 Tax=Thielaviopsis punctulata TaxID=72032 RepID=A0A0F4ZGZ1_9PEZI|nr:hypothetical protein TD95_003450 [Thielaviopsis punctulata]